VSWYSNLLLHGRSAIDTTGIENKIFQAFSVTAPARPLHNIHKYIYIFRFRFLSIDHYREERWGSVGCKGNSRVVEKSSSRVANMNGKCFSDCESYSLEGVDCWCWGRVGMSVEASCLCEFPIMVREFEDAFWAWKVCDFVVHCSDVGFCRCDCDRVRWL
jgi:hypothetical protein